MEKSASSMATYTNLNSKIEKWTAALNVIMVRVTPIISIAACISPAIWIHMTGQLQQDDFKLVYYIWLERAFFIRQISFFLFDLHIQNSLKLEKSLRTFQTAMLFCTEGSPRD